MPTRAGFRNWEAWYSSCNQHKLPGLGASSFLFQNKVTGLYVISLRPSVSSDPPVPLGRLLPRRDCHSFRRKTPGWHWSFLSSQESGWAPALPLHEERLMGAKQASDTWGAGSLRNEEAYWTPPMCQVPSSLGLFTWTSETEKLRPEGLSHLQRGRAVKPWRRGWASTTAREWVKISLVNEWASCGWRDRLRTAGLQLLPLSPAMHLLWVRVEMTGVRTPGWKSRWG